MPESTISKQDTYNLYLRYCKKNKLSAVKKDSFFKNFPVYFGGQLQEIRPGDDKRSRCYLGIQIRAENEWGKPAAENEEEGK